MNVTYKRFCLGMVLWLLFGAFWPSSGEATVAPVIQSLGQIREGLVAPTRIDLDDHGNLYVADVRKNLIIKFDIYGRKVAEFGGRAVSGAVAVSGDGSRIYVATGKGVAIVDGRDGTVLGYLGGRQEEFGYPFDLDLDGQGFVFVADAGSMTVRVYDPQGKFQYAFGGRGTADGLFSVFSSLTVNTVTNEVHIADSHFTSTVIPKVQVFDLSGKFLRKLSGDKDFGSVHLYVCTGIAFDRSGRAYYVDGAKSRMVVLRVPSGYLSAFTNAGFDPGRIQAPWDVAFDPVTRRVFILCSDGRIEVFGIDGAKNPVLPPNRPPVSPVPLKPNAGVQVPTSRPEFVFSKGSDPDNDPLVYQVQVLQDGVAVTGTFSFVDEGTVIRALPSVALRENSSCSWQVRAFDGKDYSPWSAVETFTVNAVEEPPEAPVALAPLRAEVLPGGGVLEWQSSRDPDPGDRVVDYQLEISDSSDFSSGAVWRTSAQSPRRLSDLPLYAELEPQRTYHWRVAAVDTKGLASLFSGAGSFVFDATDLRISADVPEARVFLGGNHAYAGAPAGRAPLLLRDLAPGTYSVVIEAAGFEPSVSQVLVEKGKATRVSAVLGRSVFPSTYRLRNLQVAGEKIKVAKKAAPFLVDLDNDGWTDLLVGDEGGGITFYRGLPGNAFSAGTRIDLPVIPGAVPFVADWNNDGRKDLLVGGGDGSVWLFLNAGTETAPRFVSGTVIAAVKSNAAPALIDLDGDGDKDLVVGETGAVVLFRNGGSDAAPVLAGAAILATLPGNLAPFWADWNGDGKRDLLIGSDDRIYLALRQSDNTVATPRHLELEKISSIGKGFRLFAFDMDGQSGKDLIVGNSAGEVQALVAEESR